MRYKFNRFLKNIDWIFSLLLCAALSSASLPACSPSRDERGESGAKERPPKAEPKPATAAEMALIAPLTKGSSLGGWDVLRVEGVDQGTLRVVCVNGRSVVRLDVALAADGGPAPPATAGKYAVFYSLKDASPEDGERLAKELARVVEKNAAAPPPPGMTPFVPKPPEPVSL